MKCGRIAVALAALGFLGMVLGGLPLRQLASAVGATGQNEKLRAADAKLAKAESLYKANNVKGATESLAQAQSALEELASAQELVLRQLEPLKKPPWPTCTRP